VVAHVVLVVGRYADEQRHLGAHPEESGGVGADDTAAVTGSPAAQVDEIDAGQWMRQSLRRGQRSPP
jgi:hypothetical protein